MLPSTCQTRVKVLAGGASTWKKMSLISFLLAMLTFVPASGYKMPPQCSQEAVHFGDMDPSHIPMFLGHTRFREPDYWLYTGFYSPG